MSEPQRHVTLTLAFFVLVSHISDTAARCKWELCAPLIGALALDATHLRNRHILSYHYEGMT